MKCSKLPSFNKVLKTVDSLHNIQPKSTSKTFRLKNLNNMWYQYQQVLDEGLNLLSNHQVNFLRKKLLYRKETHFQIIQFKILQETVTNSLEDNQRD